MLGVLLSWLIQLFLVHKLFFFFRAHILFSQPSLAPVHSVRSPARRGKAQMPVAGWFCGCTLPGSTRSPAAHGQDEQLSGVVCLTSQCHLCRAPCLPNKRIWRGWGATALKTPSWMEERMLSPTSNCSREHCSLPKCSASLLLPAAVPTLGSATFIWGQGNRFSHSACYWYVLLCLYIFYRVRSDSFVSWVIKLNYWRLWN